MVQINHTSPVLKYIIFLSGFLLFSISGLTQWQQSSTGMYGGNVSAFYADTASGYLYASCNGIIMSEDNGSTWRAIDSSLEFDISYLITGAGNSYRNNAVSAAGRYVYSIAKRGNCLLIGTSAGVYASPDAGQTWTAMNNGLTTGSRRMMVYSFAFKDSGTYIGTSNGVYFSAGTGRNWISKSNGLQESDNTFTISDLVFIGDNLLAASWNNGAFMSKDSGNTWTPYKIGIDPAYEDQIRVLEFNNNRIFAGTGSGIYLSRDSGRTWLARNIPPEPKEINSISIKGDTILASIPGDSVNPAKLFMSADEGNSWSQMNIPAPLNGQPSGAPDNRSFSFSRFNIPSEGSFDIYSHNGDLFIGTDFGILRSTDGGSSWLSSVYDIMKLGVTSMCKSGTRYFAGTSANGIFVSDNNGNYWTQSNRGLEDHNETSLFTDSARFIRALAVKNDTVFAGTDGAGVFFSSRSKISWIAADSGLTGDGSRVQSLIVAGNKILAGTNAGVFATNNNGKAWTRIDTPFSHVTAMVISGNNIYCTTPDSGVFMSADQGVTWQDISCDISTDSLDCIAVAGGTIFAGSAFNGLFRKDKESSTWMSVNNGIRTDEDGKMILSLFSKGSIVYAGTGAGVYMSYDKGDNWITINDGSRQYMMASAASMGDVVLMDINDTG